MKDFTGCKIALLSGDKIVMYLRDNKPGLRFANMWDFPGGGREGAETPFECVAREVLEEFSITLSPDQIIWQKEHSAMIEKEKKAYFFVANVTQEQLTGVSFGSEGQRWHLMDIQECLSREDVVSHLKGRFQDYLDKRT